MQVRSTPGLFDPFYGRGCDSVCSVSNSCLLGILDTERVCVLAHAISCEKLIFLFDKLVLLYRFIKHNQSKFIVYSWPSVYSWIWCITMANWTNLFMDRDVVHFVEQQIPFLGNGRGRLRGPIHVKSCEQKYVPFYVFFQVLVYKNE